MKLLQPVLITVALFALFCYYSSYTQLTNYTNLLTKKVRRLQTAISTKPNRRKFISYTSSQWEKLWLENIAAWETDRTICRHVLEQREQLQEFLTATCTARVDNTDWCYHDDTFEPFWINTASLEVRTSVPMVVAQVMAENIYKSTSLKIAPETIQKSNDFQIISKPFELNDLPEDEHGSPAIFSKFIYFDEVTQKTFVEYIEPLVSSLRHPLALCHNDYFYLVKRSYVIPASNVPTEIPKYYFDAGASLWGSGLGGPSLSYFTAVWLRHGIDFNFIRAWEGKSSEGAFMNSVPVEYKNRIKFQQKWVAAAADQHSDKSPFIPLVIRQFTDKNDYTLFKLDIDNGVVEMGIVNHLLAEDNDSIEYIDEFVFEHHVEGNYLLLPQWGRNNVAKGATVHESYMMFLKFRNRGVRAHSWV